MVYKGVSFKNYDRNKNFVLTNMSLVKRDIINHIFTRRGERVMMPRFGTRIPDMIMEPMDDITINIIAEDIERVLRYDPRVKTLEYAVIPDYDEKSILVTALLEYVELDLTDVLDINIEFEDV